MIEVMTARCTVRDERRLAEFKRGLGLLVAASILGCSATVSLDAPGPDASSSTGSATTRGTTSGDSGTRTDSGEISEPALPDADVPPDVPSAEACPEACDFELTLGWSWDDTEPADAPEPVPPPDPDSEPPGPDLPPVPSERRLTAMTRAFDGSYVMTEQRDGLPWMTRLSADGILLWSAPLYLPCNCEIVSLDISPQATIAFAGHGTTGNDVPVLTVGHVDLFEPVTFWTAIESLYEFEDSVSRVGSVVAVDGFLTIAFAVEANFFGGVGAGEALGIFGYEQGFLFERRVIDTQPSHDVPWRPVADIDESFSFVLGFTHAAGPTPQGYLLWAQGLLNEPEQVTGLPHPPDALVLGPQQQALVVGHSVPSSDRVVLSITQAREGLPVDWSLAVEVATTSVQTPDLAVDPLGYATAAMRTVAPDSGDATVTLFSADPEGNLAGKATLPLATAPSERPVAIESDDDGNLVLAAIVDGALHVEQRERSCRCD